jgi:hypothetical protein
MSSGSPDSLMDVFVNIQPDPKMLEAFNKTIDDTVKNTRMAFNSLQATADITAAKVSAAQKSGGGGGRGGGGGGGGGDSSTDTSQRDELAARIRAASDELQRLKQLTQFTKADLQEIGQSDLAKPFNASLREASALSLELRQIRLAADMDEEAFADVESRIASIQSRVGGLVSNLAESRAGSQIELGVRINESDLIAKAKAAIARTEDEIKNLKVDINLTRPQVVGSASSTDRQLIVALIADLQRAEIAADRLKKGLDDTPESFQRYAGSLNGVKAAASAVSQSLNEVQQVRGKSFNNLANDAYQLGQAFEDAAIGFQLNGITGAVRGASNNIAFLLNDLSQVPEVQKKLADLFNTTPTKIQNLLPLLAGVGSALAVTLLVPTIEWLQSLNDVDLKIRDISKTLSSEFEKTDFEISIRADERSFASSISDLGSVEDVLKRISEMQTEVTDKTAQMADSLTEMSKSAGQEEMFQQFDSINGAIKDEIDSIKMLRDMEPVKFGSLLLPPGREDQTERIRKMKLNQELAPLLFIEGLMNAARSSIEKAQESAKKGIFDKPQLENIKKTLSDIGIEVESIAISGGVSDPEFANKFQAGLEKAQERFNAIAKLAAEVSSITGNQLASAIDAAVLKTVELADKQALLRKQIEGSATEQSGFLLDVRDVSKVYAELIDQTAEFYQSQGQDPTAIRDILRQQEIFASENRILEQQKSLTEKLKDAEEKLGQLREKNGESQSRRSRQLTLEALSSGLQQSVLSIESQSVQENTDAVSELTGEIAGLNFEIARLNATRENLQTQFADPQGFALRQRGISFTQGLAPVDFMASPFSAANVAIREARSYLPATGEVLSGPGMTEAVRAGIEKALQNVLPALKEGQNGVKDAIKQQGTKARAGQ